MSSYQGTHALLMSALYERQMNLNWHRSKDTMPGKPAYVGGGYMSNKKWPLIEERNFLYYDYVMSCFREISKAKGCNDNDLN